MPKPTRSTQPQVSLSEALQQRLNSYALMASVTGVGLMASVQPSAAKIVYTPIHHVINPHRHYDLDLNHDGVTDLVLRNRISCNTDQCFYELIEKPAAGNSAIGIARQSFFPYASALPAGVRIGPKDQFIAKTAFLAFVYQGGGGTSSRGPWANLTDHYLGLRFKIKGKLHYGWARLTVKISGVTVKGILTGYAYETIPNKPIIAGKTKGPDHEPRGTEPIASITAPTSKPATLGVLAMGSPGLSIWRREKLTV